MLPDNIKRCHIPLICSLSACEIASPQTTWWSQGSWRTFFNAQVYFPVNIHVHKHKSVQWSTISVIAQIRKSQSMNVLIGLGISRSTACGKSSDPKIHRQPWHFQTFELLTKISKYATLVIYNWKIAICSSTAFLNLGLFLWYAKYINTWSILTACFLMNVFVIHFDRHFTVILLPPLYGEKRIAITHRCRLDF